jgi:methylthioribose-1-phosphate isomerase
VAARHGIPFYVAAPLSTVDFGCASGASIPIEERAAREVTHVFDRQIAPSGIRVANPAFDVTPSALVTAVVTERGIARAPYDRTLARFGGAATAGSERRAPGTRRARRR